MKIYRANTGPFNERPYYELAEIESICLEELNAIDLYPKKPEPIRIERFIEKRFNITPRYDDLPDGVLGFTLFGPKGAQDIVVARSLSEEGSKTAERRINTTLAHEAGHALLHGHLFACNEHIDTLFEGFVDPKAPKILCREILDTQSNTQRYDGRWWEYQANRIMGALLLPRHLVEMALDSFLIPSGSLGNKTLSERFRVEAMERLTEVFDVNPIVAKIRIGEIYPVSKEMQLKL